MSQAYKLYEKINKFTGHFDDGLFAVGLTTFKSCMPLYAQQLFSMFYHHNMLYRGLQKAFETF